MAYGRGAITVSPSPGDKFDGSHACGQRWILVARKVQVILSDDLDENLSADETVSFSLDGTSYEIDLADKNAKEMRDVFSRYVSAARKVGRGSRTSGGGGGGRGRSTGGRMDR